jgi:hypothetical protein
MIEMVLLPSREKIIQFIILEYNKYYACQFHYSNLKDEISILYQEIFMKKIDSMYDDDNNNKEIDLSLKLKLVREIKDAFSKGKLTELHYNLLLNKISEMEK